MASAQFQDFVDSSLENWSFHIQLSKLEELQTSRSNNKPLHLDIIPFFFQFSPVLLYCPDSHPDSVTLVLTNPILPDRVRVS